MHKTSILFLSKNRKDAFAENALSFVTQHFPNHKIVLGNQGQDLPDVVRDCEVDYLISYLSPWIIPQAVLKKAKVAAINFHPGPPEYPGIGCYNFAIYNAVAEYGVTCHHMARAVDTGKIIAVRRFSVFPADTVHSIAKQSSAQLLALFYEVMSIIAKGRALPVSDEIWKRKPYTKTEMYELFRIKPEMSDVEIQKRIKAAEYPGWPGAFIEVGGRRFYQNPTSPISFDQSAVRGPDRLATGD